MLSFLSDNFAVWQDSFYPYLYGGSKARKLRYILEDAKTNNANAIVSAGSASSNHARDCALASAQLGWGCTLVIHDKEDYQQSNLFLMKLSGAELIFCGLPDVGKVMDQAMEDYKRAGKSPYYIYGGGHTVHGALALFDAVAEFKQMSNGWEPDYVVVPSGTGGTQAGLHLGFEKHYPNTQVIGISVARNAERGLQAIKEMVDQLRSHLNLVTEEDHPIKFIDEYVGQGYGDCYPELLSVIVESAKKGLLTDTTYTGKALYGALDLRERNKIPASSNVLFWHTGGIFNLLNDNQKILEAIK